MEGTDPAQGSWPSAQTWQDAADAGPDPYHDQSIGSGGKRKRESDAGAEADASRPRSSRIGLMEDKKRDEEEARRLDEEDAHRRSEEKRVAREMRRAEKAAVDRMGGRLHEGQMGMSHPDQMWQQQQHVHASQDPSQSHMHGMTQPDMMHTGGAGSAQSRMMQQQHAGMHGHAQHHQQVAEGAPVPRGAWSHLEHMPDHMYAQPSQVAQPSHIAQPQDYVSHSRHGEEMQQQQQQRPVREHTFTGWTPIGKNLKSRGLKQRSSLRRRAGAVRMQRLNNLLAGLIASPAAVRLEAIQEDLRRRQRATGAHLGALVRDQKLTPGTARTKMEEVRKLSEMALQLAMKNVHADLPALIAMAQQLFTEHQRQRQLQQSQFLQQQQQQGQHGGAMHHQGTLEGHMQQQQGQQLQMGQQQQQGQGQQALFGGPPRLSPEQLQQLRQMPKDQQELVMQHLRSKQQQQQQQQQRPRMAPGMQPQAGMHPQAVQQQQQQQQQRGSYPGGAQMQRQDSQGMQRQGSQGMQRQDSPGMQRQGSPGLDGGAAGGSSSQGPRQEALMQQMSMMDDPLMTNLPNVPSRPTN